MNPPIPEGEMFKKKTQPRSQRLLHEVSDVAVAVGDAVRAGSAQAIEASGPALEKANAFVGGGAAKNAPKLRRVSKKLKEAADQVRPDVNHFEKDLRPRLEKMSKDGRKQFGVVADQVADQFDSLSTDSRKTLAAAKKRVADDWAPEATERAGALAAGAAGALASAQTPKAIEELAAKLTGDKKAVKKAKKTLKKAGKDIEKRTAHSGMGTGTKVFLWMLVLVGLAGVAYFVWRKAQPVEDPWSTPLEGNRPADARPVGTTPASRQTPVTEVSETPVPAAKVEDVDADAEEEGVDEFGNPRAKDPHNF
ncbi:hypothetical protein M3B11_11305 [Brevibacterium sp. p3-SID960]|uniref:hypothetical protein n=1 Tax=Brevibacterium sp. p3-SID960 TaxID=2916063 RepID=UPI0021A4D5B5|nr:hypothetical protein [Brevibacterium sp. p3-SID960]MCT1691529.1 hypothetical protein [Brevibacterium sp. p3-SID960]